MYGFFSVQSSLHVKRRADLLEMHHPTCCSSEIYSQRLVAGTGQSSQDTKYGNKPNLKLGTRERLPSGNLAEIQHTELGSVSGRLVQP